MKIGVKTYDNENFLKHFEDKSDFFEVMAVQKNDYSFLKNFYLPIVIHAEHQAFGFNPADISKKEFNLKSVNFARRIADVVNSEKIIVHPGDLYDSNCSLENSINFFNELNDGRICIENLPTRKSKIRLCSSLTETENFLRETKTKFCFDINHTLELANDFSGDYSFIKEYIKLNPAHYHFGGQKLSKPNDHLCLEDSELDLKKILSYYPRDAEISLETEPIIDKTERDINIIRNVIWELN
jgi:hypothetical protein